MSVPQFIVGGILAALFMGLMLGFERYGKSRSFRKKTARSKEAAGEITEDVSSEENA